MRLQEILKSNWSLSMSGNVSFTENGDRDNPIYGFENVIDQMVHWFILLLLQWICCW